MKTVIAALTLFASSAMALPCIPEFSQEALKPNGFYTRSDWSGCDLSSLDLSKSEFRKMDLRRANMKKMNLSGTNFSDGKEPYLSTRGSNLAGADLSGSYLREADFSGHTPGSGANLAGVLIYNTPSADHVNFRNAILTGATIRWFEFNVADFTGAEMSGMTLEVFRCFNCEMPNIDFTKIIISSDFALSDSNLGGANFSGLELGGAWFDRVRAVGAKFSGTNLDHARFNNADLRGGDLTNSILTGINFNACDLRGTDLSGATIGAWGAPDMTFFLESKREFIFLLSINLLFLYSISN